MFYLHSQTTVTSVGKQNIPSVVTHLGGERERAACDGLQDMFCPVCILDADTR